MNTMDAIGMWTLEELPQVVDVPDQPCQQLYEANPVLLGFDVVHYHDIPSYKEGGRGQQGSSEFAYNFHGYQFWFINQDNRERFMKDPWQYAPAWGGFCSWGIARELPPQWPWKIDYLGPPASPWTGWSIVDGVLIFNIWESYTDLFMQDGENNMRLAAQRWKNWFGKLEAGPFNTHCIGEGSMKNWCLARQPSPWTQELPTCENITIVTNTTIPSSNTTNTTNTTDVTNTTTNVTVVSGGGIVSDKSKFDDFENESLSPYQRKWRTAAFIGIPIILVLFALLVYKKCNKKKPETLEGNKEGAGLKTKDSASYGTNSVEEAPANL
mmetsp:Transcript_589/g.994  ORF Transcript_589/g.994 Transcript_589/m.994 type:complete len:325 (-) Transcript_589:33-1007(-)